MAATRDVGRGVAASVAAVVAMAGTAVAGFAGGLLVDGVLRFASVSWPAWQDRVGR
ncbi:hypothetical protein B0I31_11729 [Saccharothrix carnea]|uniref:Uncharacterized protein n=1 Tax=Saccharothrix carnea TaxID=1280637 RepID=A0A2P8I065_SACCR|nr:hypothetical protein [Saccharothrix carnea]PSL51835.1 hypothetical protein B0I31_11729 [Saccharothrix carnea]